MRFNVLTNKFIIYAKFGGEPRSNRTTYSVTKKNLQVMDCEKNTKRCLAVFDFDYTISAQNTDTVVRDILSADKIPKELHYMINTSGWTAYMQEVFKLLHQHHITPTQICNAIQRIPEVPGLVRLMKRLHQQLNFDLIIISDSNFVFIWEWLKLHGLTNFFTAIFTNPAHFDDTGLLHIEPYHHQTECRLSAANLCKGKVLERFIMDQDLRHQLKYERVVYVGDGNNDICPVLRLKPNDIACARRGFSMDKNLEKNRDKMKVHANLLIWKNGFDLLDQLEVMLKR